MNISKAIAWLIKAENDLFEEDGNFEFESISVTEKGNKITIKRFQSDGKYLINEQNINQKVL